MLKIFSSLAVLLFCLAISAQAQSVLEARFGSVAMQEAQGSEKLELLEFQNIHGYTIQDLSGEKDITEFPNALDIQPIVDGFPVIESTIENGSIELFAYAFPIEHGSNLYYRLGNTGKVLVIYSTQTVKDLFSQQQNGGE